MDEGNAEVGGLSDRRGIEHPEMFEPNPLYAGGAGTGPGAPRYYMNESFYGAEDYAERQPEDAPPYADEGDHLKFRRLKTMMSCGI